MHHSPASSSPAETSQPAAVHIAAFDVGIALDEIMQLFAVSDEAQSDTPCHTFEV
jgi:hypothetical protein